MRKAWQVRCRMARHIEAALNHRQSLDPGWTPLLAHWLRGQRLFELLQTIRQKKWNRAQRWLSSRLPDQFAVVREHLHHYLQDPRWSGRPSRLSFRDLVSELVGLEDEFARVELDLRKRLIKVTTDPITLQEVDLGGYEITLEVNSLRDSPRYRIRSCDGVASASDSSLCHPHVSHGSLCEGDGRLAIAAALETGRLGDFLVIVRQILETYNPGSAYVSLEDWEGFPCGDCGDLLDRDESSSCYTCGTCLCSSCTIDCSDCDEPHCSGCLTDCEDCHRGCCERCVRTCVECRRPCCDYCRSTAGRCESCEEAASQNSNTEEEPDEEKTPITNATEPATATATEVHAHGLGQAGLVAGSRTD